MVTGLSIKIILIIYFNTIWENLKNYAVYDVLYLGSFHTTLACSQ